MGLGVGVLNARVTALDPEKLKEWLDSVPEVAKEKEPASVLALVFFVETLKSENRNGGADSNA